jgi:transcriptional regulator with XRE-family HTH domain
MFKLLVAGTRTDYTNLQKAVNTKMQNNLTLDFPRRLRELRSVKSQALIAKELGVNQQTYARWELGDRQPKLQDLCAIALHFNVTADWLLGVSDKHSTNERAAAAESKLAAVKKSLIALVKEL